MTRESKPLDATVPHGDKRVAAARLEVTVVREAGAPSARVVVLDGDRLQIGSHPKNDLVLEDPEVSRFHCLLERGASSWRVSDAGSLNGTLLGGISVRDADLPSHVNLELGSSAVRIRELPADA